jgi:hypothetical protein
LAACAPSRNTPSGNLGVFPFGGTCFIICQSRSRRQIANRGTECGSGAQLDQMGCRPWVFFDRGVKKM